MPLTFMLVNGILKVDIIITNTIYIITLSIIAYYNEIHLSIVFMKIIKKDVKNG